MSFRAELRRRNVFKVGAAYALDPRLKVAVLARSRMIR